MKYFPALCSGKHSAGRGLQSALSQVFLVQSTVPELSKDCSSSIIPATSIRFLIEINTVHKVVLLEEPVHFPAVHSDIRLIFSLWSLVTDCPCFLIYLAYLLSGANSHHLQHAESK